MTAAGRRTGGEGCAGEVDLVRSPKLAEHELNELIG